MQIDQEMSTSKAPIPAKVRPVRVRRPNMHSKLRKRMQPPSNLIVQHAESMEVDNIKNQEKSSCTLEPI